MKNSPVVEQHGGLAEGGTKRALTQRVSHTGTPSLNTKRKPMLVIGALTLAGALGAAALAVHHVPAAGPLIANSLRAVIGIRAVARLEEAAASAEDALMRYRWQNEPPRSLASVSPTIVSAQSARVVAPEASETLSATAPAEAVLAATPARPEVMAEPAFTPAPITPPFAAVAAPGDGEWVPVPDPQRPDAPPLMYKTLLHPDPERRYAELFVVAMPSDRVQLSSVPGTEEPATDNPEAKKLPFRGLIPPSQRDELLAAFNGGFRAEHGRYGMMVDGVTLLAPRADVCTIAGYDDGSLQIGTYSRLAAASDEPLWYRQTPRCMVEQGKLHPGLSVLNTRGWGATLDGETVIRRSAIALSEDRKTLLVAVTNFTTARALALGMQAAGGHDVAQLDVNRSFPKFLLFPRDESGARHAESLFNGFLFTQDEMIDEPNPRDFFYVVRRGAEASTQVSPAVLVTRHSG